MFHYRRVGASKGRPADDDASDEGADNFERKLLYADVQNDKIALMMIILRQIVL